MRLRTVAIGVASVAWLLAVDAQAVRAGACAAGGVFGPSTAGAPAAGRRGRGR